jgi:hypothetical protein
VSGLSDSSPKKSDCDTTNLLERPCGIPEDEAGGAWNGPGVRIYGRLHWDKHLSKSHFVLTAEGSTVTVRRIVPDEPARTKAIALVADTVGVIRVIDQRGVLSSN